jgi:3D (Asp-Asp-Asp) domain-containing protein
VRTNSTKYGIVFLVAAAPLLAAEPQLNGTYTATAYAQHGITASGEYVHRHVVAADPAILPIGTRVKISRAGPYSGEYVVADTGNKIEGRKLDIYLPDVSACRKFGVKRVNVTVIELGNGTRQAAKQADQAVKQDVTKDVQKGTVGSAATEADWAAKGGPVAAAVTGTANPEPASKRSGKSAKRTTKDATSSSTANSAASSTSTDPK